MDCTALGPTVQYRYAVMLFFFLHVLFRLQRCMEDEQGRDQEKCYTFCEQDASLTCCGEIFRSFVAATFFSAPPLLPYSCGGGGRQTSLLCLKHKLFCGQLCKGSPSFAILAAGQAGGGRERKKSCGNERLRKKET